MRRGEPKTLHGVQAFPLSWPAGVARTKPGDRRWGRFTHQRRQMTVATAVKRLLDEAKLYTRVSQDWRIDPDRVVVSSNLDVKRDGLPYSNQRQPGDPGVAVYFQLDDEDQCVPIDTYTNVEDNIAAVAAILASLRALERHGHRVVKAAFQGFKALPGGDATATLSTEAAASILADGAGSGRFAPAQLLESLEVAKRARNMAASRHHPDRNGDPRQMDLINKAWATLRTHFGA